MRAGQTTASSAMGVGAVGVVRTSEAGTSGAVGVGSVLSNTNSTSTGCVSSSAEAVRIDPRVGLVGSVCAMRASGVV